MAVKHLLSIADLDGPGLWKLLHRAVELKKAGLCHVLAGRTLALLFEKPSLRTRVSFDVAMYQLGGFSMYLSQVEVGLGVREPIADVARVLSRYVNGIVVRTFNQSDIAELARHASVPVINGLSDDEHPCQAIADFLTIYEKKGRLEGLTLAFIGDGNNVSRSLMLAASLVGANFRIASPQGYELSPEYVALAQDNAAKSGACISLLRDPAEAVDGSDVVYTDVWVSMGQEKERSQRVVDFRGYQVNAKLLAGAKADAIVMHDLPAHHGEEIGDDVFDCPQSVIFDQSENRLHAQKAILAECMGPAS